MEGEVIEMYSKKQCRKSNVIEKSNKIEERSRKKGRKKQAHRGKSRGRSVLSARGSRETGG